MPNPKVMFKSELGERKNLKTPTPGNNSIKFEQSINKKRVINKGKIVFVVSCEPVIPVMKFKKLSKSHSKKFWNLFGISFAFLKTKKSKTASEKEITKLKKRVLVILIPKIVKIFSPEIEK